MRKILSFLFLIVTLIGFSQSGTIPVASDVSTSFYLGENGTIHLVGTDLDYDNLTFNIVTLPSHGKLFDGATEITAPGVISGNTVTFKHFNADTDSTAYNETLEPNFVFDGTINFTYNVNDGTTNSSNATVTIKIFDQWHSDATAKQLGADITGDNAQDFLGFSLALNETGDIMAVGEPKFDPPGFAGSNRGAVSVYSFNGSDWVSYGARILGENNEEQTGASVSLSGNGKILAVGASKYNSNIGRVRVYQKAGSVWNRLGGDIEAKSKSNQFGNQVRLSSDGHTLAIGDVWYSVTGTRKEGRISVYRLDGLGNWNLMGNEKFGTQSGENQSWSISMSSDGNFLAASSPTFGNGADNDKGKVTVYKYDNANNEWDVWATIIDPLAKASDYFGTAIDFNSDGSRIAIGARGDDAPDPFPNSRIGTTQIYSIDLNTVNTYSLVGNEILGEAKGDYSGSFVSLDNEGNTVAIAAPRNDGGGTGGGHVRLYNFDGSAWVQKGIDFDGEGSADMGTQDGNRTYISGDNSVLAIGFDKNNANSKVASGKVEVFEIFDIQTIPIADPGTYSDNLNEQETTNFITLTGSDAESEDLTYLITSLTDAKIYHLDDNDDGVIDESDTPIFSKDLPYKLTKNGAEEVKVKYNSITDDAVVDFFEFKVVDAKSSSIAAKIQLTIIPVNDAPVPTTPADTYQTNEDTGVEITLEGTDPDSTDSDLKYIIFEYPANGTLKEGSDLIDSTLPIIDYEYEDGTKERAAGYVLTGKVVTYTPNDNFTKPDSFKFKVRDTGALDGKGPLNSDNEVEFILTSKDSATVSINVNNTDNDPPVGVDDDDTTGEETPITIKLSATDPDEPDLTNLKYTIEVLPTYGTIVDPDNSDAALLVGDIVTSNNVKYTPNLNFTDTDTFKFSVTDTGLNGDDSTDIKNSITQATFSVLVTNSDNDPPVPDADSKNVDEQGSVIIIFSAKDPDEPYLSNLKFKVDGLPLNGVLTDPGNSNSVVVVDVQLAANKVIYTHDGSETDSDEFTFKAIDTGLNGDGLTDIKTSTDNAKISITVNPKNDAPVSSNSAISTNEEVETSPAFDLSASDVDDDDTTLIYTVTKLPDNGILYEAAVAVDFGADVSKTLDAKTLTYLPELDFFGEDNITFTAKDDDGESSNTATVTFKVVNVNDAPIATSEDLVTDEDTESGDLILKATDVDDDDATLVYTITKLPVSGTLKESGTAIVTVPKILDAKTVTYEPNAGFNGADSFTFTADDDEPSTSNIATINITVSEFNDPPLATDGTLEIDEDALATTITLTGSDDETDNSTLTFIIATLPLKGILTDPNDTDLVVVKGAELKGAEVDYKSNPHSNGADSFTFKSKDDGNSAGLNKKESTAATISITINSINDTPVAKIASYSTDEEEETADFDLVATDPDDTILIYTVTKLPDNGILKESDVAIDLADLPKILDAKTLSYLPALDFVGDDTIKFSADDDEPSTSNIATVTFTVLNLNDDPIASDESITVEENKSSGDIILLASDVDDTTLVYTITKLPDSGVLKESGTEILQAEIPKILVANTVVYTPNASYNGNDSFTFTANDDDNAVSNTGTISIVVTEVNDPPVATSSALPLEEDEALGLSIVLSGTDPEDTSMDAIIWSLPTNGVLKEGVDTILATDLPKILTGDVKDLKASVVYFPELNYNGDDSFNFKVEDKGNSKGLNIKQSTEATVSLTINPVNDAPEADNSSIDTDQETPIDIIHVGRDLDLIDVLSYIITSTPSNGILKEGNTTITAFPYTLTSSDQKLTYIPDSGYYGTDAYNFKLNDGTIDSNIAAVTINIKEFILQLPLSNYKITPTETCKGSDFGVIDIEVTETSYKISPSGIDIPINYNITIDGIGSVGTIMSPDKTAKIKDLAKGTYELIFTVQGQPKYIQKINVDIKEVDPPIAHPVSAIEICDDNVDGEDDNGKVNFDTSLILNTLLKDPVSGNIQDETLFDIEFTYYDQTTNSVITEATLPNPFYSAAQTISVKFTSKTNGLCSDTQTIDFIVNPLPLFERIEDTISVCSNLDPVTIGVKSSDSKVYTYTWTRNGSPFAPNIAGIDSSILIGKGGEYIVTATSSDGTNCSKSMTIDMKESSIAVVKKKDIVIKDLNAGPNNTITILTTDLGIGDYEYALDDKLGPYQDEPVFDKIRPGIHTIYIRDKNECGVAKIKINVIGYKKFFTPNGDGIHDTWNIIGLSSTYQAKTKIYIFDRYGKLLKELDPLGLGWDGTYIGNPLPSTDYWFRVQLEDGREFKSHFSLVRPW